MLKCSCVLKKRHLNVTLGFIIGVSVDGSAMDIVLWLGLSKVREFDS